MAYIAQRFTVASNCSGFESVSGSVIGSPSCNCRRAQLRLLGAASLSVGMHTIIMLLRGDGFRDDAPAALTDADVRC